MRIYIYIHVIQLLVLYPLVIWQSNWTSSFWVGKSTVNRPFPIAIAMFNSHRVTFSTWGQYWEYNGKYCRLHMTYHMGLSENEGYLKVVSFQGVKWWDFGSPIFRQAPINPEVTIYAKTCVHIGSKTFGHFKEIRLATLSSFVDWCWVTAKWSATN